MNMAMMGVRHVEELLEKFPVVGTHRLVAFNLMVKQQQQQQQHAS